MAASTEASDCLRKFLIEKLKAHLHIFECEKRLAANSSLINLPAFWQFVKDNFEDSAQPGTAKLKNTAHNFSSFAYFSKVNESRRVFLETFGHCGEKNDLNELFNVYAHGTFVFANKREPNSHEPPGKHIPIVGNTRINDCNPSNFEAESSSALYRLGGGTLGELWKISKKRKELNSIPLRERIKNRHLYQMCFAVRMNQEEKYGNLTPELIDRDRGGMFFPKPEFLPFISKLNDCVRKSANSEALHKFGKKMIKVCVAEVTNTMEIFDLYSDGIKRLRKNQDFKFEDSTCNDFFKIWVRKMTHARVQEFISGVMNQNVNKGGHTLRDTLYSCVKKNKTDSTVNFGRKKKLLPSLSATKVKNEVISLAAIVQGSKKKSSLLNQKSTKISLKCNKSLLNTNKLKSCAIKMPLKDMTFQSNVFYKTKVGTISPLGLPGCRERSTRVRKRIHFDDYVYQ